VELRPGTPRIVHHAFIRFDPTRESRRWDARDPEPGFSGLHTPPTAQMPAAQFLSWQPGRRASEAPNGLSWLPETNTDLVLQLHLQSTGKPEQIQPSVGFYFTDQPPMNTPVKIGILSHDLDIPRARPLRLEIRMFCPQMSRCFDCCPTRTIWERSCKVTRFCPAVRDNGYCHKQWTSTGRATIVMPNRFSS
jgi:hypothetical protein